ncbi:HigA protein (antitoxin to HigB) [hydrothermal vent metagenome]|uniref:HigA protein (Antitoxin to HigB) n=1 Tax=hydrothermal vent metagenome TaxID=652676 RepID=A0A3B1BXZ6_9ZZZZ
MPMKNPPHPVRSIKGACLEPLNLTVTDGAKILGVARHTLSRVINGQAGISPDMAIRLEKASAQQQTVGYACRQPTSLPRPDNMKTRLM